MPGRAFGKVRVLGLAAALWCAATAGAAAGELVRFVDGGSLVVESCDVREGRAVLRFQAGEIVVPASRILEVAPAPEARGPAPAAAIEARTAAMEAPDTDGTAAPASSSATGAAGAAGAVRPDAQGAEVDLDAIIREAAARYGLHPDLLAAVIATESAFRDGAVSPKGAMGLMQLMPATARELDVSDPFDPRQNVEAGARYLRQLLDRHRGPKGEESFVRALAAYNAGGGKVARYDGLPPYRETIEYVRRVLRYYASPPSR